MKELRLYMSRTFFVFLAFLFILFSSGIAEASSYVSWNITAAGSIANSPDHLIKLKQLNRNSSWKILQKFDCPLPFSENDSCSLGFGSFITSVFVNDYYVGYENNEGAWVKNNDSRIETSSWVKVTGCSSVPCISFSGIVDNKIYGRLYTPDDTESMYVKQSLTGAWTKVGDTPFSARVSAKTRALTAAHSTPNCRPSGNIYTDLCFGVYNYATKELKTIDVANADYGFYSRIVGSGITENRIMYVDNFGILHIQEGPDINKGWRTDVATNVKNAFIDGDRLCITFDAEQPSSFTVWCKDGPLNAQWKLVKSGAMLTDITQNQIATIDTTEASRGTLAGS
jgi:hypothetical protein